MTTVHRTIGVEEALGTVRELAGQTKVRSQTQAIARYEEPNYASL